MTAAQRKVLAALDPAEWFAHDAAEVAAVTGMTQRGAQAVLYHLCDADLVRVDEFGYYLTERGVSARARGEGE